MKTEKHCMSLNNSCKSKPFTLLATVIHKANVALFVTLTRLEYQKCLDRMHLTSMIFAEMKFKDFSGNDGLSIPPTPSSTKLLLLVRTLLLIAHQT